MSEKEEREKEVLLSFVDNLIEHSFKKHGEEKTEKAMFNRCVLIPQILRKADLNKKLKEIEGPKK